MYLAGAVFAIWLLTRYWLPEPFVVAGHDSGLAIDSKEFLLSRLYAWSGQGFGQDNSAHFGSIILHSLDYLVSLAAGVPYAGNQLLLFFWLILLFLSAFVFSFSLGKRLGKTFSYIFPIFFTFNFYIIQSLFILERAKYSLMVAVLLLAVVYIKFREKKFSLLLSSALASLILFVFNSGSWLGLPLYGSLGVLAISILVFEFIECLVGKKFYNFGRMLGWMFLTGIAFLGLNSYSILPYLSDFLATDYKVLASGAAINIDWLNLMSQSSSFLNIFRLQGIPDWYAGPYSANVSHAYAVEFLTNPFFIIVSFIFPIAAISSFVLAKDVRQKKVIGFFGLVLVISMFFVAGSHPPLGFIYELLFQYLPGFSILRSPYFKFGASLIFSISVLMVFTVSRLSEKVKIPSAAVAVLAITIWLSYHYILFQKDTIFSWQKGYSTKLEIPEYLTSFRDWFLQEKSEGRILLLPPLNNIWRNDAYTWGYWSLSTLPSLITRASILANDSSLLPEEKAWLDKLYLAIGEKNEQRVYELMARLGIDFILLRMDVLADGSWSATSQPKIYKEAIADFVQITKVQTFGEWELYRLDEGYLPKFTTMAELSVIPSQHSYLGREFLDKGHFVFKDISEKVSTFSSSELKVYECQSCALERKTALESLPRVTILPNSPLYYLKVLKERKTLLEATTPSSKADAYLGFVLRRAAEIKTMLDFGLEERYIQEALESMNSYLEILYEITLSTSTPESYERARVLLDLINPVKKNFREYVSTRDFGEKSEKLRQGILDILWQIFKLESYYPILSERDRFEKEKIYSIEAARDDFFIATSTLPQDSSGIPLFPQQIIYSSQGVDKQLFITERNTAWTKFELANDINGSGNIMLRFPKLPNLLTVERTSIEQSPTGTRACYAGKINNFDKNKRYLVKVKVTKKDQSLRLFFKETSRQKGRGNFIFGEDEVDVDPILTYEPFSHIYYPSAVAVFSNVYLCSGNKELPVVDKIEIHEIFSPIIVSTKESATIQKKDVVINYEKINPASYLVTVKAAEEPFILFFNERYHPMWRLLEKGSSGELLNYQFANENHFIIDGYANGWVINKKGDFDLVLEFLPQKLFKKGVFISSAGLISVLAIISYWVVKRL